MPGARSLARLYQRLAEPAGLLDTLRGVEDFNFPGAWDLLDRGPHRPDILHCHNLHGKYFDLRALPALSRCVPVMLTLHDAWLLAGHCAHATGCERWRTGCGACPDLSIYPSVRRDATAENWRRKAAIFRNCRLHVATPCRWLMEKVQQSILAPAIIDARVIPNGVDSAVFHPGDRATARKSLGLPQDADILLFAAYGVTTNSFKDFATLRKAAARLGSMSGVRDRSRPLRILALGETGATQQVGRAVIRLIPHVADPRRVADYHRAADVYVHASKADTFPTSILEAMACGRPVVATAVGGIPEQIVSIDSESREREPATGLQIPPGDAEAMASGIALLLTDDALRYKLGEAAARRAAECYQLDRQVAAYLEWYREILRDNADLPSIRKQQAKKEHESIGKDRSNDGRGVGDKPGARQAEVVGQGTAQ